MEHKFPPVRENALSSPEAVKVIACGTCGAVIYCPPEWNWITITVAWGAIESHKNAFQAEHRVYIIDPKTKRDHTDPVIH